MKNKIKNIMASVFEMPIENLQDSFSQHDIENWDSLHHLNLVIELENEFNISLEPEEIGEMNSFEKIVELVKSKTNNA
jgi:acyl carrier protein